MAWPLGAVAWPGTDGQITAKALRIKLQQWHGKALPKAQNLGWILMKDMIVCSALIIASAMSCQLLIWVFYVAIGDVHDPPIWGVIGLSLFFVIQKKI